MALNTQQRLDRLKVRLEELKYWRARETVNVTGWTLDGSPIEIGAAWPDRAWRAQFRRERRSACALAAGGDAAGARPRRRKPGDAELSQPRVGCRSASIPIIASFR